MDRSTLYLSPGKLAERLGVSEGTLHRWREAGMGPPWTRLGPRRIGYQVVALEAWEAARTVAAGRRAKNPATIAA